MATCATPKSAEREAGPGGRLGQDHDVLGLHIAVDHAARVRARAPRRGRRRCATSRSEIAPALVSSASVRPRTSPTRGRRRRRRPLVDPHDARVVEPRRGARLALDALAGPALLRDDLDGHLALQLLVPGQPYNPEPRPEPALQPVAAEDQPRPEPPESCCVGSEPPREVPASSVKPVSERLMPVSFLAGASCPPFILPSTCVRDAHPARSDPPVLPGRTRRARTSSASPPAPRSFDRPPDADGPPHHSHRRRDSRVHPARAAVSRLPRRAQGAPWRTTPAT